MGNKLKKTGGEAVREGALGGEWSRALGGVRERTRGGVRSGADGGVRASVRNRFRAIVAVMLAFAIMAVGAGAFAVPEAVLRASGDVPKVKTGQTEKYEKELEKLTSAEKDIKQKIAEATINRTKLLSQKRADLRLVRQERDGVIKIKIAAVKIKKESQSALIKKMKEQQKLLKKSKNQIAVSAADLSIKLAQIRLDEINGELAVANGELTKSYNDYKAVYDRLTYLDGELKKILDLGAETESKIKEQKKDYQGVKTEYSQSVKSKDFLTAEKRMGSLVFIQTGINDNYEIVLDFRKRFKSDYYEQIINYKL